MTACYAAAKVGGCACGFAAEGEGVCPVAMPNEK